jgi:hypothetical protein
VRPGRDDVTSHVILPNPTQPILVDQTIVGWQLYATSISPEHAVRLTVWRQQGQGHNLDLSNDLEHFTYRLVAATPLYQPQRLRTHSVTLLPEQHVVVKRGDVIGIYFPLQNPIPWSQVPCQGSLQGYLSAAVSSSSRITLGTNYIFKRHSACRIYSLRIVFGMYYNSVRNVKKDKNIWFESVVFAVIYRD